MTKVDRDKLTKAIAYRNLINRTPFNELDFSEYPEIKKLTKLEIAEFEFTGLNNTDFISLYLEGEQKDDKCV